MPSREAGLSDFMVKADRLWKLKEIVNFALNLKGNGPHNPKNNSLVIHRLITAGALVDCTAVNPDRLLNKSQRTKIVSQYFGGWSLEPMV